MIEPEEARVVSPIPLAEPGHTPRPEVSKGPINYGPTLRPSARPAAPKRLDPRGGDQARVDTKGKLPDRRSSANLLRDGRAAVRSKRPEDGKLLSKAPQAATNQVDNKLIIGPGGALRKIARQVSFKLPEATVPSPTNEIQAGQGAGQSSNNENSKPIRAVTDQSAAKTTDGQDSADPRRVTSLVQTNAGRLEFSRVTSAVPPAMSPATPKDFKVRGARFRKDQDDALQSLKLAAERDDTINLGSPQGMLPTLKRVASGVTGGLA